MDQNRRVIAAIAIAATDHFLSARDDSDSDSEALTFALLSEEKRLRLRGKLEKQVRIEGYVDITVPRFTDEQFRQHFRITRATFENLEQRLAPTLNKTTSEGRSRIPVRKQLLSVLWLLATPDSYRSVGDRFDMSKSILHDSFIRVIRALCDVADSFISWPTGEKLISVKNHYRRIGKLPNVIGAIDCSHITIPKPKVDYLYYKTRKHVFAITLQAVCDAELMFTDCFAGFAGSVPDNRVFRNSDLWKSVTDNQDHYFPDDEYLIGDKAYPVLSWCIPPFIDRGNLNEEQVGFNKGLSQIRQTIERAFGLLKGRFRRLQFLDMARMDLIPFAILACCVLHNICLLGKDENNDEVMAMIREGQQIMAQRPEDHVQELMQEVPGEEPDGVAKRNHLVHIVAQQRNGRNRN